MQNTGFLFSCFQAIGGAAYYAADFINLTKNFDLETFERNLKTLCNSSMKEVSSLSCMDKHFSIKEIRS